MSNSLVVGISLSGFAMLLLLIFWVAWRTYTPRGFLMYLAMWICMFVAVLSAVRSTWPSSAQRRQAVGIITHIREYRQGKSHTYTVDFAAVDGSKLEFDAVATPLFFAEGRDQVAVTYLDEHSAGHYPEPLRSRR